mgnify:CR=1 FL=1
MNINSLHPADFKKVLKAHSGRIDIFVNYYDVEARCVFFAYARLRSNNSILIPVT